MMVNRRCDSITLLEHEEFDFLKEISESFLVLLSLTLEHLHCLVQSRYVLIELEDLGILLFA